VEKSTKRRQRGGKSQKTKELALRKMRTRNVGKPAWVTPQGNADEYQNKGVAEKAIRKSMKTKGEQNRRVAETHGVAGERRDQTGTLSATLGYRLSHALLFVK
jgi:hypothetical protein